MPLLGCIKLIEAPDSRSVEFQVRANNGADRCGWKKVSVTRETRRSVMLNDGPVNKKRATKKHIRYKNFLLRFLCFFVTLSKPTDDRETLAARNR